MKHTKRILALALMLVMLLSALPLTALAYAPLMQGADRYLYISLSGYSDTQLSAFPASEFLSLLTDYDGDPVQISGAQKIAWTRDNGQGSQSDNYTLIDAQAGTMDLRFPDGGSFYIYMVVGSGNVLDSANHRYSVRVRNHILSVDTFEYRTASSPTWNTFQTWSNWYSSYLNQGVSSEYHSLSYYPTPSEQPEFQVNFHLDGMKFSDVHFYSGNYQSADAAKSSGKEITGVMQGAQGTLALNNGSNLFGMVYTLGGIEMFTRVSFHVEADAGGLSFGGLYNGNNEVAYNYSTKSTGNSSTHYYCPNASDVEIDAAYALKLYYYKPDGTRPNASAILSAYVDGNKTTNIKDQLFGDTGYTANYSGNGHLFEITDEYNTVWTVRIILQENDTDQVDSNGDPWFQAKTVMEGENSQSDYLVMPSNADSLYSASTNAYQTILLKPSQTLDMTALRPVFWLADGTQAYASADISSAAVKQTSGQSVVNFSTPPVQYTAKAANGTDIKNYWVTYVQKQSGSTLFVNGPSFASIQTEEVADVDKREVLLSGTDSYHDIFLANLGSTELSGLSVSLDAEAQKTLKLDDFWTVGGTGNDTVAPFTSTSLYTAGNVSKIRLRLKDEPENLETSEIGGVLTISSGSGTRYVYLTDMINPSIITETVPNGVKYVPYSVMIQTNNHSDSNTVTYSLFSGKLPDGVSLNSSTGEIYGVPTTVGNYTFTVQASFSNTIFPASTKTYTIEVADNSDANVASSNDAAILDRVVAMGDKSDEWNGEYHDQIFHIDHTYDEFVKFFLDGEELSRGTDYDAEEGSTKITIRAKTFANAGKGKHTIAAEFRDQSNVMKKVAQNYESFIENLFPTPPVAGTPTQNPTSNTGVTATFRDVRSSDWFYQDVLWAYKQNYMVGVSNQLFAPNQPITQAMTVTILARIMNVDLTRYKSSTPQLWYTAAANWAADLGILSLDTFQPSAPLSRGDFAVMLVKLFDAMNVEYSADAQTSFSDAPEMSAEENIAFQILYPAGIFLGNGKMDMRPDGNTTRAQMAALTRRLSSYVSQHIS